MKDIIIQVKATKQTSEDSWEVKTPSLIVTEETTMGQILKWIESVKCCNGAITEAKIIIPEKSIEPLNF
jgi:hypothetical protein